MAERAQPQYRKNGRAVVYPVGHQNCV